MIGFNRIPHGKSRPQRVKATNTHGVWGKSSKYPPTIKIEPTFWESILGKVILFILFILGLGLVFYMPNNQQIQKTQP